MARQDDKKAAVYTKLCSKKINTYTKMVMSQIQLGSWNESRTAAPRIINLTSFRYFYIRSGFWHSSMDTG